MGQGVGGMDRDKIAGLVSAIKTATAARFVPKEFYSIIDELMSAIDELGQRVAKVENNILDDPDILSNPDVLKK
jgi:hypothetical protein